jgi:anti-sigma factor RsiW
MVDDRFRELMDRLADGTLTPEEREILNRLVESDDEARACYQNQLLVSRAMADIPVVEPPSDLKQHVLESLRVRERRTEPVRSLRARLGELMRAKANWRYAYTFGAGVVCGLLALALSSGDLRSPSFVSPGDVAGTMSVTPPADAVPPVSTAPFKTGEARGVLSAKRLGQLVVLQAEITSAGQVVLDISTDTTDLAYAGFWKPERFSGEFTRTADGASLRLAADAMFSLAFIDKTPTVSTVRCQIRSGMETETVVLSTESFEE